MALSVIKVHVNGVLVDTGCSRSIVSADSRAAWSDQQVDMRTIDGTSRACCGVGTVSILTNGDCHAVVNVLVARERPLGYDLLIGIDVTRALRGVMTIPVRTEKKHVRPVVEEKKHAWPFVSMNGISVYLSTITRGYGPPGGNGPWATHRPYSTIKFQNIRYPITSGESTRGNCKCGSRTVGWSLTPRNDKDPLRVWFL